MSEPAGAAPDGQPDLGADRSAKSGSVEEGVLFVSEQAAGPGLRLSGLTLLQRALFGMARTGIRRCFVVGRLPALKPDPRLPADLRVLPTEPARALEVLRAAGLSEGSRILCMHADVVLTPAALRHLLCAADGPAASAAFLEDETGAALRVGVFEVRALAALWPLFAGACQPLRPGDSNLQLVALPPAHGRFARVLGSSTEVRDVEESLFDSLEHPRDGFIDQWVNRKLSRHITHLLLPFPVHPNVMTVVSCLVGLAAAAGFAWGTYWAEVLGAFLFQAAVVLDCCDGEIARLKLQESRFGDLLDITLDNVVHVAIFSAIAWGALGSGQVPHASALGAAAVIGVIAAFVVVSYAERRLPGQPAAVQHRLAKRIIKGVASRDFSVIVLLASVLAALPLLLWAAAVGVNLFWMLLAFLLVGGGLPREVGEKR